MIEWYPKDLLENEIEKMEKDNSGFFDLPISKTCNHPEHKFPSHLWIPFGKGYKHICPSCGNKIIVRNPIIF